MGEAIGLHEALDIFSDHLPEIREALIENVTADLQQFTSDEPLPPKTKEQYEARHLELFGTESDFTGDMNYLLEIHRDLYNMRLEAMIGSRKQTLERINSRLQPRSIQQRASGITDDDIAKAKEFPMDQLYTGKLFGKDAGRRFGHCPFHQEKTASFCIHKDNRWSCFGSCNEHGDTIAYVMKRDGIDFISAVRVLINS